MAPTWLTSASTRGLARSRFQAIVVVTTLIVIFGINWQLSLLAIGILPLFILPTRSVGQLRKAIAKETQERIGELTSLVQETLSVSGHLMVRLELRQQPLAQLHALALGAAEVAPHASQGR